VRPELLFPILLSLACLFGGIPVALIPQLIPGLSRGSLLSIFWVTTALFLFLFTLAIYVAVSGDISSMPWRKIAAVAAITVSALCLVLSIRWFWSLSSDVPVLIPKPSHKYTFAPLSGVSAKGQTGHFGIQTTNNKSRPQSPSTAAPTPTGIYTGTGSRGATFIDPIVSGYGQGIGIHDEGTGSQYSKPIVSRTPLSAEDIAKIRKAAEVIPPEIDPTLSKLSNEKLKLQTTIYTKELRRLELPLMPPKNAEEYMSVIGKLEKQNEKFQKNYKARGLALRNALLRRLNKPLVQDLRYATIFVEPESRNLAGPRPITDLANALDDLAAELPK